MIDAFVYLIKSCLKLGISIIVIASGVALAIVYLGSLSFIGLCLWVGVENPNLTLCPPNLTPWLIVCYVTSSLITIYMYRIDKLAAKRGQWRISEAILHYLELSGGWPGALLAQKLFRHKTKKKSFRLVYNLIIIFYISLLINIFLFKGLFWWLNLIILLVIIIEIEKKYARKRSCRQSHKQRY